MPILTKEQLKQFLTDHPAISKRSLSLEANLNENAINQLFNKSNRNITQNISDKLIKVMIKYGYKE
ncbi:MAG: hypothetical protein ACOWWH_12690 [Eubacteriaceae bacterium]